MKGFRRAILLAENGRLKRMTLSTFSLPLSRAILPKHHGHDLAFMLGVGGNDSWKERVAPTGVSLVTPACVGLKSAGVSIRAVGKCKRKQTVFPLAWYKLRNCVPKSLFAPPHASHLLSSSLLISRLPVWHTGLWYSQHLFVPIIYNVHPLKCQL